MKILITGANGQLGRDCTEILSARHQLSCCDVPNIDITDQQKGSRFLREITLKNIKNTDTELYDELEKMYLTDKAKKLPIEKQIYLICKNIRDTESNPRNNRVRFEQRNYHKQQLQFNF